MRPKEFFDSKKIQESENIILALYSEENGLLYEEQIKKPIEERFKVNEKTPNVKVKSYTDNPKGKDSVDSIWQAIAEAKIVIADISDRPSTVLLELGVVLAKKDHVIIIAERKLANEDKIPFPLKTLEIIFYEKREHHLLKEKVSNAVDNIIGKLDPAPSDELSSILNDIDDLIRSKKENIALRLISTLGEEDKGHWQIQKRLGELFLKMNSLTEAEEHIKSAFAIVESDKNKALCKLILGRIFIQAQKTDKALKELEEAQRLDPKNVLILLEYAKAYESQRDFKNASNIMQRIIQINKDNNIINKDYNLRLSYYIDRFTNPDITYSFEEFKKNNSSVKRPIRPNNRENNFILITEKYPIGTHLEGVISNINWKGYFIRIDNIFTALVPKKSVREKGISNMDIKGYKIGSRVKCKVIKVNHDMSQVTLEFTK